MLYYIKMTLIYQVIFNYYKQILVFIGSLIAFVLFRNNTKLKQENKEVKEDSDQKTNAIILQTKIIEKVKATKSANINGTVKRMLDKDL